MESVAGEDGADGLAEEVGVFEEDEEAEVEHERQEHEGLAQCALPYSAEGFGYEIVGDGDQGKEHEEESAAFVVEEVGEQRDEEYAQRVCFAEEAVDERETEKQEEEDSAAKYHRTIWLVYELVYDPLKIYVEHLMVV